MVEKADNFYSEFFFRTCKGNKNLFELSWTEEREMSFGPSYQDF